MSPADKSLSFFAALLTPALWAPRTFPAQVLQEQGGSGQMLSSGSSGAGRSGPCLQLLRSSLLQEVIALLESSQTHVHQKELRGDSAHPLRSV